jgi:hypothetical protein
LHSCMKRNGFEVVPLRVDCMFTPVEGQACFRPKWVQYFRSMFASD